MANWSSMTLTNAGEAILAAAQINESTIVATGIGVGAGTPSDTALGDEKYVLKIQNMSVIGNQNEVATIVSDALVNSKKSGGFDVTELGLYVQNGDDTILYAYCTDDNPDNFPEYDGTNPVTLQYTFNLKISGTESFTATIGTDGYVTVKTVIEMLKKVASIKKISFTADGWKNNGDAVYINFDKDDYDVPMAVYQSYTDYDVQIFGRLTVNNTDKLFRITAPAAFAGYLIVATYTNLDED